MPPLRVDTLDGYLPPVAADGASAGLLLVWYKTVGAIFPPAAVLAGTLTTAAASKAATMSPNDALAAGAAFLIFPWLTGHGGLYLSSLAVSKVRAEARVAMTQNQLKDLSGLTDDKLFEVFVRALVAGQPLSSLCCSPPGAPRSAFSAHPLCIPGLALVDAGQVRHRPLGISRRRRTQDRPAHRARRRPLDRGLREARKLGRPRRQRRRRLPGVLLRLPRPGLSSQWSARYESPVICPLSVCGRHGSAANLSYDRDTLVAHSVLCCLLALGQRSYSES